MRVLITGMSGTGKSTVIAELVSIGYSAVDLDCDEYSEWAPAPDGDGVRPTSDWVWREAAVSALLDSAGDGVLFVAGSASNQARFYPRLEHIVLLSAPAEVIVDRLLERSTNVYGRDPEELARCLRLKQTIEPLMREAASLELDTSAPLEDVVRALIALVEP